MKTLLNKSQKALRVPLPKGKSLHLPPGKSGQIADAAAEHPPLLRLVEAGELEVQGSGVRPFERTSVFSETAHGAVEGRHSTSSASPRKGDRGG
ncbi:MAG: hypothetical protein U0002_06920 [Thermoanaerobaculia bacterium]